MNTTYPDADWSTTAICGTSISRQEVVCPVGTRPHDMLLDPSLSIEHRPPFRGSIVHCRALTDSDIFFFDDFDLLKGDHTGATLSPWLYLHGEDLISGSVTQNEAIATHRGDSVDWETQPASRPLQIIGTMRVRFVDAGRLDHPHTVDPYD